MGYSNLNNNTHDIDYERLQTALHGGMRTRFKITVIPSKIDLNYRFTAQNIVKYRIW